MLPRAPLPFIIILLVFSLVLSSAAVPTTRILLSNKQESSIQTSTVEEFRDGEQMLDVGEELMVEGRMDMESADYPGTGANNHHDPRTPGRP